MTTRQIVFAILGLLVTFGLVYFVVVNWAPVENEQTKFFENQVLGLSFSYPSRYKLTEREVGNAERGHYQIMLAMSETPSEPEIPREGPPAITIDIYQNNLDRQSLTDWLDTNDSNYKQAISPLASTTIVGQEAVRYTWDGLYRGDTTAFVYGSNIFAFTVTYLGVEDQIRNDYQAVLSSLKLSAITAVPNNDRPSINFSQRGVAKKDPTGRQGEGLTLLYEKPGSRHWW